RHRDLRNTHSFPTRRSSDLKMPKGDQADCAAACAKMGRPMALLTDDGKVYELTGGLAAEKNAKIIPHITHTVEVTGDVTEKDGKDRKSTRLNSSHQIISYAV